jgi:hypothetical protein
MADVTHHNNILFAYYNTQLSSFDRSSMHRRGNFLLGVGAEHTHTNPELGSINVRLTESGTPLKGSLPDLELITQSGEPTTKTKRPQRDPAFLLNAS